ncbi:MAG: hypothetical protein RL308_524 [Bacteroidota bacterium]|jgi:ABC-type dipeptide/oligopeptide/nickel transport system ATPase subunit
MRLHEIHINNFKFFPQQKKDSPLLKIDGNNLLIYGENGSGKSTIFWALYTLFENAFKINEFEIEKYFVKSSEFSLVNIYARNNQITNIKIVLKDGANKVEYEVNNNIHQIVSNLRNSSLREIGMASDFINYRVIFRLHQIKHSNENDLFGWFKDEIFPYILIADIDSTKSVDIVYKEISNGPSKVKSFDLVDTFVYPNSTMESHSHQVVKNQFKKYKKYKNTVKKWNTKLEKYLKTINLRANDILLKDFNLEFEIKLIYKPSTFTISDNNFEWVEPKIELKIPKYNGKRNVIKKPHTFLNEAKWTSIALALRFAIIEDWTNRPSQALLKVLVIDDMLLSLDMGNRDTVLNILLDRVVDDYQLILMTHDRYFYEMTKIKIGRKGKMSDWLKLEMYEDTEINTNKRVPIIIAEKGKLSKAWGLFKSKDFASSANMLRQASEKLCRTYLSPQEQLGGDYKLLNLNGLLERLISKATEAGITINLIKDLLDYKNNIMNPSSHYDIEYPLFENELKKALDTLDNISKEMNIEL